MEEGRYLYEEEPPGHIPDKAAQGCPKCGRPGCPQPTLWGGYDDRYQKRFYGNRDNYRAKEREDRQIANAIFRLPPVLYTGIEVS